MSSLRQGLISGWEVDETGAANRVDWWSGYNLVPTNSPGTMAGVRDNALLLVAASSQKVAVADNAGLSSGNVDFTDDVWLYFVSKPGTFPIIMGKFTGAGNQREQSIFYNSGSDRIGFIVSSDGANQTILDATTFGSPPLTTWIHVTTWHDSVNDTLNIQINDGTVDSVAYSTGVFDGTGDFTLGSLGEGGQYFDGGLDMPRYWKRILTATERTINHNGGLGRSRFYIVNSQLSMTGVGS